MASDPEDKIDTEKEDKTEPFRSVRAGAGRLRSEHLDEKGLSRHLEEVRYRQQTRRRTALRGVKRPSMTIPRNVLSIVRKEHGTKPEDFGIESVEQLRRKQLNFALGEALSKEPDKEKV